MFVVCFMAIGPKSNQVIYRSGPWILPKMKEIWKVVHKLSREQNSAVYEPVQKHKVTPGIPGWLNDPCFELGLLFSQFSSNPKPIPCEHLPPPHHSFLAQPANLPQSDMRSRSGAFNIIMTTGPASSSAATQRHRLCLVRFCSWLQLISTARAWTMRPNDSRYIAPGTHNSPLVQWPLLLTWFNFNPSMDK